MKVHHIIDALKGNKDSEYNLAVPNINPSYKIAFIEWMDATAKRIKESQHFVFENLPISVDGSGGMNLPGLTKEEQDMFSMGLLPLPFELCWFEVPFREEEQGSEILCYLLEETDSGFMAIPFRIIDGNKDVKAIQITGERWEVVKGIPGEAAPNIHFYDTFGGAGVMDMARMEMGMEVDQKTLMKGEVGLISYLLLMLSSKTTEFYTNEAPTKLNKRRRAKGKAEIPEHRVVSIIPRKAVREYRDQEKGTAQSGARSSPRIHWRRSHLRQLSNGKSVVVARALIGYRVDPEREKVSHSYKVKL